MRCTMCKARQTIVLTRPRTSDYSRLMGWRLLAGARVSIRSECYAWENCPCRSNSGTLRDGCGGAGNRSDVPPAERYLLLGHRHERIRSARHLRDHRRAVEHQDHFQRRRLRLHQQRLRPGRESGRRILGYPVAEGSLRYRMDEVGIGRFCTKWERFGRTKAA